MKNSELDHILRSAPVPERPGEFWEKFPTRVLAGICARKSAELQRRQVAATQSSGRAATSENSPPFQGWVPGRARSNQAPSGAKENRLGSRPFLPSLAGLVRIGILAPTVKMVGYFLAPWRVGTVFGRTAVAVGLSSVLVVAALLIRFQAKQNLTFGDPQFAELQKCYREIEPLFPNQLKAIIWDNTGGPELVLAEAATVPSSTPLYLRICGPNGCRRFVTFSGQQIQVNGDVCDVLLDRQGNIIIAGRQLVWSSAKATGTAGHYQIEARPVRTTG